MHLSNIIFLFLLNIVQYVAYLSRIFLLLVIALYKEVKFKPDILMIDIALIPGVVANEAMVFVLL